MIRNYAELSVRIQKWSCIPIFPYIHQGSGCLDGVMHLASANAAPGKQGGAPTTRAATTHPPSFPSTGYALGTTTEAPTSSSM